MRGSVLVLMRAGIGLLIVAPTTYNSVLKAQAIVHKILMNWKKFKRMLKKKTNLIMMKIIICVWYR